MDENTDKMAEARAWNACHPDVAVSSFACRYPGEHRDASDALRQVRKELSKHENIADPHTDNCGAQS